MHGTRFNDPRTEEGEEERCTGKEEQECCRSPVQTVEATGRKTVAGGGRIPAQLRLLLLSPVKKTQGRLPE